MFSYILSSTSYIILWNIMNVNVLDNIIKSDLLSESVVDLQCTPLQSLRNIMDLYLQNFRRLLIFFKYISQVIYKPNYIIIH